MARTRQIKPGFFLNETLGAASPLARLLFAGIWCIADRSGRLEDRPARIKVELLPYDDCDVDALLWELSELAFLQRYEVDGTRYIEVANFERHQSPHPREAPSELPEPPTRQDLGTAEPGKAAASRDITRPPVRTPDFVSETGEPRKGIALQVPSRSLPSGSASPSGSSGSSCNNDQPCIEHEEPGRRLYDVFVELSGGKFPSALDRTQLDEFADRGCTAEHIDAALAEIGEWGTPPDHPWAALKAALGRQIARSLQPEPVRPPQASVEEVEAMARDTAS